MIEKSILSIATAAMIAVGAGSPAFGTELARMVIINRVEQSVRDIPAAVSVISRSNIVQHTAVSLAETLRHTPGMDIQGSAYPGAVAKPVLRGHGPGLQSKRVLVLVDGRRVAEPFQSVVEFSLFQSDNIERVEVLRGPASALYGSDAIAGVINVITRRGQATPVRELRAAGGSHGFHQFAAASGGQLDDLDYFVTGSHLDTDGYTDNRDGSDRDWRADNLTGNFGYALSEDAELRLFAGRSEAAGSDDDSDRTIEKDYLHAATTWTWDRAREDTLVARLYHNNDDQVYDWTFPGIGIFDMQTTGGELQQSIWAGDQHRLVGGVDFRDEEVDVTNITGPINEKSGVVGVYLQDQIFISDSWSVTAGLRLDDDDNFGAEWSPRFGLLWHASPETDWYASVHQAHRAPALSDRFFRGEFDGRLFEGNPDLEPETATAYELGFRQRRGDRVELDLAVFYNDLKDSFEFAMDADGVFRNRNVARSQTAGIEAGVQVQATETLHVFGNATVTDGEYDEFPTAPEVEGNQLQYLAQITAATGVAYDGPLGYHALSGRYTDQRYADDRNSAATKLDDYVVVDWRSRVPVGDRLVLTLNVDNLFDEKYAEFFGIPQPGLTVIGGVELAL